MAEWGRLWAMTSMDLLRRAVAALALAAPLLGAAADVRAEAALVSVGDELAVGKNRTGEACRIKLVEISPEFGVVRRYRLFCDGWTQPSGDVWSFPVAKGYSLDKLLTDSVWEKNFSQRLGGCG